MSKIQYSGVGRLPKHVTLFHDRHGKARYRYRRMGLSPYYFKAQPGTGAFQLELEACKAAKDIKARGIALRRTSVEQRLAETKRWNPDWANCSIYFIASEAGPIKIGLAQDVAHRFKTIQSCSPVKLRLAAEVVGNPALERDYHRNFAPHRLHGEWFTPHPDILAEIARLTAKES